MSHARFEAIQLSATLVIGCAKNVNKAASGVVV